MTNGNCMWLIIQFFLPILAGNFFQQFYSFVDSVIVGKGVGDNALAAVGNTGSVSFLILGFTIGLTGGLGICISQSFGAEDTEKLRKEITMSVWVCAGISIFVTAVSLAFMNRLFLFLQTPASMMQDTLDYFRVILLGITVTIFNNFAMTMLRSVGNSRIPLVAMILSSVVNVALDLLFVFPLGRGVTGAAEATILSQVVSLLFCVGYIGTLKELLPRKKDWKIEWKILKRLTLTGLPIAFMNSVTAVGCMVLQYFVNGMGTGYVAAYAACTKICSLFQQAGNAVGLALLSFAGQNYGAGKIERIRQGVRDGVILSILINIPLALAMLLLPEAMSSFMLTDQTVISYTREYLMITGIAIFPLGWLFVFRNACQGMGHTVLPMFSGVLEVALRFMMAILLVRRLHFRGIALSEISAWIGAFFMLMMTFEWYYRKSMKKEQKYT